VNLLARWLFELHVTHAFTHAWNYLLARICVVEEFDNLCLCFLIGYLLVKYSVCRIPNNFFICSLKNENYFYCLFGLHINNNLATRALRNFNASFILLKCCCRFIYLNLYNLHNLFFTFMIYKILTERYFLLNFLTVLKI